MGQQPPRTVGRAIADMDMLTAGALAGLALVVLGSIGPWVTSPLTSVGGLTGDGKWTVALAVIGAFLLLARGAAGALVRVGIECVLILVIGIYDAVHIQHVVAKVTLFNGTQLGHVGWGVYAVIVGALGTLLALYRGRARRVPAQQRPAD